MVEANSISGDSKGNIWIASRGEGLYRILPDGTVKRYVRNPAEEGTLLHNNVRDVCEDNQGNLFVGTYNGLCHLNLNTERFTEYNYKFLRMVKSNRSILTMMYDRQGTLWIGTFYEGIQLYHSSYDIYRHYEVSDQQGNLTSSVIGAMAEDNQGRLWLGTEGGGLNVLDRLSGHFATIDRQNGLSSDVIKSLLYEPRENVLWAATLYDGINRIDLSTGHITKINNQQSRPV